MGTFRDDILPEVDEIRGSIPGELGLRLFDVEVFRREWDGARPGLGSKADFRKPILVALGRYSPKVRNVTAKDVIASGGLYTDQDIKVGPITPPFTGSEVNGTQITIFDPPQGATGIELYFRVLGPGYPPEGAWFTKLSQTTDRSFHYDFVLRKTGKQILNA